MFDENMSMFFANLEKLFHFDQMGLEFPSSIEDDSNIFNGEYLFNSMAWNGLEHSSRKKVLSC